MGDMSMYFRMIDSLVARSDDLPAGYACRKQVKLCSLAPLFTNALACLHMHSRDCLSGVSKICQAAIQELQASLKLKGPNHFQHTGLSYTLYCFARCAFCCSVC